METDNAYPIYLHKKFIFAIFPFENQPIPSSSSDILLVLLLGSIIFGLLALLNWSKKQSNTTFWIIPLLILLLRFLSLKGNWLWFMESATAFQPTLYASSEWLPNFGEYLINCLILLYFSSAIIFKVLALKKSNAPSKKQSFIFKITAFLVFLLSLELPMGSIYRTRFCLKESLDGRGFSRDSYHITFLFYYLILFSFTVVT